MGTGYVLCVTITAHLKEVWSSAYSTYNYMGKLNNRLLAAVRRNDIEAAQQEQRRSQAVIRLLEKYGEREEISSLLVCLTCCLDLLRWTCRCR